MVVYGNITGINLGTYYSSFISLRSMRTVVLLDEQSDIEICTGDIRNSYLTVSTTENIVFIARPEFTPFGNTCHLILIKTTLYSLKISGASLHLRLSDTLIEIGLVPSMRLCDIWMRNEGDYY